MFAGKIPRTLSAPWKPKTVVILVFSDQKNKQLQCEILVVDARVISLRGPHNFS